MLCKYFWIVLYTVHVTAFCLGGGAFFSGHDVFALIYVHLYFVNFASALNFDGHK